MAKHIKSEIIVLPVVNKGENIPTKHIHDNSCSVTVSETISTSASFKKSSTASCIRKKKSTKNNRRDQLNDKVSRILSRAAVDLPLPAPVTIKKPIANTVNQDRQKAEHAEFLKDNFLWDEMPEMDPEIRLDEVILTTMQYTLGQLAKFQKSRITFVKEKN